MTNEDLELGTPCNHLWESANILRGPVDAADFKTYIFPLLFFKRISDVYDEEMQTALEESGGEEIRNEKTPIVVEKIVADIADIDGIVRIVRFDGWQDTTAGQREVKKALRSTLLKYKLHGDQELFDRAYGYIEQYY